MWDYIEESPKDTTFELEEERRREEERRHEEQRRLKEQKRQKNLDSSEIQYRSARALYSGKKTEELQQAKALFLSLGYYKDAAIMAVKCDRKLEKLYEQEAKKTYQLAKTHYKSKKSIEHLTEAKRLWESIPNYKDSDKMTEKCAKRIDKLINPSSTGLIIAIIVITAVAIIAVIVLFMSGVLNGGSSQRRISSSPASVNVIESKSSDTDKKIDYGYGDLDGTYYIEAFDEYCDISGNILTFYSEKDGKTKSTEWYIDFSRPTLTAERYDGEGTQKIYVNNDGSLDLVSEDGFTLTLEKKR